MMNVLKFLPVIVFILLMGRSVLAEDFENPHTFEAGDVLSADVLNEIFSRIKNANTSPKAADLVGTWNAKLIYRATFLLGDFEADPNPDYVLEPEGITYDAHRITKFREDRVEISLAENGAYSFSTEKWSFIQSGAAAPYRNQPETVVFTIHAGRAFFKFVSNHTNDEQINLWHVKKISPTRFELAPVGYGDPVVILDKTNIPPKKPSALTGAVSSGSVSLAWSDNSDDETGFNVFRKSSATATFSAIGTTNAGVTSFSNTGLSSGIYWYRVKATNQYGDSTGTKVLKVVIP